MERCFRKVLWEGASEKCFGKVEFWGSASGRPLQGGGGSGVAQGGAERCGGGAERCGHLRSPLAVPPAATGWGDRAKSERGGGAGGGCGTAPGNGGGAPAPGCTGGASLKGGELPAAGCMGRGGVPAHGCTGGISLQRRWKLQSLGYAGMRWVCVWGVSAPGYTGRRGGVVSSESTGVEDPPASRCAPGGTRTHGSAAPEGAELARGYLRMLGRWGGRDSRTPGPSPHWGEGGVTGKGIQSWVTPKERGTPPQAPLGAPQSCRAPDSNQLGRIKGDAGRGWRRRRGELNELLFFL